MKSISLPLFLKSITFVFVNSNSESDKIWTLALGQLGWVLTTVTLVPGTPLIFRTDPNLRATQLGSQWHHLTAMNRLEKLDNFWPVRTRYRRLATRGILSANNPRQAVPGNVSPPRQFHKLASRGSKCTAEKEHTAWKWLSLLGSSDSPNKTSSVQNWQTLWLVSSASVPNNSNVTQRTLFETVDHRTLASKTRFSENGISRSAANSKLIPFSVGLGRNFSQILVPLCTIPPVPPKPVCNARNEQNSSQTNCGFNMD